MKLLPLLRCDVASSYLLIIELSKFGYINVINLSKHALVLCIDNNHELTSVVDASYYVDLTYC
jgi:hypothetical protein